MSTLVLDTHVVHWWTAEPELLSRNAEAAIEQADELAVSAVSWYELAWLAKRERIMVATPIESWLQGLAARFRTYRSRR